MKTRLISAFLALCLMLSLLPVSALAADGIIEYPVEGGSIYFNTSTGMIARADRSITAANIPAQIGGVAVTGIQAEAFGHEISDALACQQLREVTLPEGVTVIGDKAFAKCIALEKINIPSTVSSIGFESFMDCKNLQEITLPEGLTELGQGAFGRCASLKTMDIPGSVEVIPAYLLSGCTSLEEVRIGEGVTSIKDNAFAGNDSMHTLHIPRSVEKAQGLKYSPPLASLRDIYYSGYASEWSVLMDSIGRGYADSLQGPVTVHFVNDSPAVQPGTPGEVEVVLPGPVEKDTCTVTFDPNGNNVQNLPAVKTVKTGERFAQPMDPIRPGYIFGGWYRDAQCTGEPYFVSNYIDDHDPVENDLTLYAKWKLPITFTKSDLFDFVSKDPTAKAGYAENMAQYCVEIPKGLMEKLESAGLLDDSQPGYILHNLMTWTSILLNPKDTDNYKGYPVTGNTYEYLQKIPYGSNALTDKNFMNQQINLANWDDFISANWFGSCFGLTTVTMLAKANQIKPSYFGANTVSQFVCPAKNEDTANLVNFYQMMQQAAPIQNAKHAIGIDLYDFIHTLQTNDKPLLLSIGIFSDPNYNTVVGGHALLAYNCVFVPATAQVPAHFEVDIWDSNRSAAENLSADHTVLSIPADGLRDTYMNTSSMQAPVFSHMYDTGSTGNAGGKDAYYSFLTSYLTVDDFAAVNLQTKSYGSNTIGKQIAQGVVNSLALRTNYASFTITSSSGASAEVKNGKKVSGTLDITGGSAMDGAVLNSVGQDLLLEFSVPALGAQESYTIAPKEQLSVVTGKPIEVYTTVLSDFSEDGYFARAAAADTGTITVTGSGTASTAFPSAVSQSVTVVRGDAETPWFNNTAVAVSTGVTAAPLSDGSVRFTSAGNTELTLAVKDTEGLTVFDPVTPDSSGVRITQQGENTAALLNSKGDVIASKPTASAGVPDTPDTTDTPEGTLPFTDVKPGQWFYDAVAYVSGEGLMTGITADTFAPNGTTTRGMIVTILHRLEGSPAAESAGFTDVPGNQWYTGAVNWAAANDIVSGYGGDLFGPNDPITREQMAAILYRYAAYKGYDVSARADLSAFTDLPQVSAYAAEPLQWAKALGLVGGKTADTLVPKGSATRAEVATILMRFRQTLGK
ncbi:MAG: leucine-rich repeat protein [Oscillospiraceae bacterium]|nr:leucine-rich repeat protein [Oscillospiraceae bacterium]